MGRILKRVRSIAKGRDVFFKEGGNTGQETGKERGERVADADERGRPGVT